jgi:hypothetical protein
MTSKKRLFTQLVQQPEYKRIDSRWVGWLSNTRERLLLYTGQVRLRRYLVALPDREFEYRSTLLY